MKLTTAQQQKAPYIQKRENPKKYALIERKYCVENIGHEGRQEHHGEEHVPIVLGGRRGVRKHVHPEPRIEQNVI